MAEHRLFALRTHSRRATDEHHLVLQDQSTSATTESTIQTQVNAASTSATNAAASETAAAASQLAAAASASSAASEVTNKFNAITTTTATGAEGTNAAVAYNTANNRFDFTVPRGDTGATGATGTAATIAVGTVSTGSPGSSATVTNSGTSGAATFDFAIPRGDVGATGRPGPQRPSLWVQSPQASRLVGNGHEQRLISAAHSTSPSHEEMSERQAP